MAGDAVLREFNFGRGIAGFNVTTEGVGETISGLSDALGLSGHGFAVQTSAA